jgi:hypothetical protein
VPVNYGAAADRILSAVEAVEAAGSRTGWEDRLRDEAVTHLWSALLAVRKIHHGKRFRREP